MKRENSLTVYYSFVFIFLLTGSNRTLTKEFFIFSLEQIVPLHVFILVRREI